MDEQSRKISEAIDLYSQKGVGDAIQVVLKDINELKEAIKNKSVDDRKIIVEVKPPAPETKPNERTKTAPHEWWNVRISVGNLLVALFSAVMTSFNPHEPGSQIIITPQPPTEPNRNQSSPSTITILLPHSAPPPDNLKEAVHHLGGYLPQLEATFLKADSLFKAGRNIQDIKYFINYQLDGMKEGNWQKAEIPLPNKRNNIYFDTLKNIFSSDQVRIQVLNQKNVK